MNYCKRLILLMAYYGALTFAFRYFMLVQYGEDMLEVIWVTTPDAEYPVLISVGLALLVSAVAAGVGKKTKDVFLILHAMFPLMPMLVIYAVRGAHTNYMLACVAVYLLVVLVTKAPLPQVTHISRIIRFPVRWAPFAILLLAVIFVVGNIATGGLSTLNFDFDRVYEFRRAAQDNRGIFLSYLSTNLVAFLIGFGCVTAYAQRRYWLLALMLALNLVIFGLTSHKSHFFAGIAAIGIYIVMTWRKPIDKLVIGAAAVCVASVLIYWADSSLHLLGTFTVRRVMFVPAYANFMYYDFFSHNPFVFWSDSKIGLGIVPPVYDVPTPQVISSHFTGIDFSQRVDRFNNINTAWLGTSYAHLGLAGMTIYAIVVGIIIRSSELLASKTSRAIAVASLFYPFVFGLFCSSDIPSAVLSHGIAVSILTGLVLTAKMGNRAKKREGVPAHPA